MVEILFARKDEVDGIVTDITTLQADVAALQAITGDGDRGDITVSGTGTVWTIDADAVTYAKIQNAGGSSVLGRSAASSGNLADIVASGIGQLLTIDGASSVVWGTAVTASIGDAQITNAKISNRNNVSVMGRSADSSGPVADIQAGSNDTVLQRVSNALSWGTLTVGMFPNDVVTYAKIQDVSATDRVLGRSTAGAGDIEEIVHNAQGRAIGALSSAAGIVVVTGAGTATQRAVVAAGGGSITVTNGDGAAGNITLSRAALTGDVTASADSNATTIANNAVSNAKLADMAQNTFKGRASGAGTGDPVDLTYAQAQVMLQFPRQVIVLTGVNFNSVADTTVNITLPTGATHWRGEAVLIKNTGTTASLTTAQFAVYSAVAAGGTNLHPVQAMTSLTSNAVNTTGAVAAFAASPWANSYWNFTQVFFRITTAQGAAASGDVYIVLQPLA